MPGVNGSRKKGQCGSLWWNGACGARSARRSRCWNWYWPPASGCASAAGWTLPPCGLCWTCCGGDPLPASVRVYLCLAPCDMRKSFDSLQALVREHLELDVFAGHLFVFTSRRKDRVKILYWDRDGFAVWSKRLEEGTYAVPFAESAEERRREITAQELGALLSGIDLNQAQRRKRYQRSA